MVRKLRKRDVERLENTSPAGFLGMDVADGCGQPSVCDVELTADICGVSESCVMHRTNVGSELGLE